MGPDPDAEELAEAAAAAAAADDPASLESVQPGPEANAPAVASLIDVGSAGGAEEIASALDRFLREFEATRMVSMPAKVRKKLTLAAALVSRGSGLDVFGPLLIEHACADCGLGASSKIDSLRAAPPAAAAKPARSKAAAAKSAAVHADSDEERGQEVSSSGGGGSESAGPAGLLPAAAATPSPYVRDKLVALAHALRRLPALLRSIATEPGPAYAIVERGSSASLAAAAAAAATAAAAAVSRAAAPSSDTVGAPGIDLLLRAAAPDASASAVISVVEFPAQNTGFIGTWDQIQIGSRLALAASTADAPDPLPAAAPTAPSIPPSDAASVSGGPSVSGVAAGGLDGDADDDAGEGPGAGVSAESQAPQAIAFDMVDFAPVLFAQFRGGAAGSGASPPYVVFPSFDVLCDEYFSRLDVARAERTETQARSAAERKLDRIREGHLQSVTQLQARRDAAFARGRLIESNSAIVDNACLVVRSALEHGVGWLDLERLVVAEAAARNPVASIIASLDLAAGTAVLALRDAEAADAARERRREQRAEQRRAAGEDVDEDHGGNWGEDDSDEDQGGSDGAGGGGADGESERIDEDGGVEGVAEGDADAVEAADAELNPAAAASASAEAVDRRNPKKIARRKNQTQGAGKGGRDVVQRGSATQGLASSPASTSLPGQRRGEIGKPVFLASQAEACARLGPFMRLVRVDVRQTAAANARACFAEGKSAREKEGKTLAAAEQAIRRAERTVADAAAKQVLAASSVKAIRVARRALWFERFHWFITSEGLVCVAGRNAQDNEQLVKRYLRPQDAYIHADTHGAATVVLRSLASETLAVPLPPLSLTQAGHFCVCLSSAWAAHATTSAWWVPAAAVSKTAPTGEYLGTGSFMVRGRKNFLPPAKLELGVVLLFKVDDSCVDAHVGDRFVRGGGEAQADAASAAAATLQVSDAADASTVTLVGGQAEAAAAKAAKAGKGDKAAKAAQPQTQPQPQSQSQQGKGKQAAKGRGGPVKRPAAEADSVEASTTAGSIASAGASKVRGKTGKAKRAARRYADQDDEDRALAMAVLGHKPRAVAAAIVSQAAFQRGAKAAAGPAQADVAPKFGRAAEDDSGSEGEAEGASDGEGNIEGEGDESAPEGGNAEDGGAGFRKAHAPSAEAASGAPEATAEASTVENAADDAVADAVEAAAEAAASAAAAADDDNNVASPAAADPSAVAQEARAVAALVAAPRADDILTHAVPMLAPWPVALTHKLRVKLVPGTLKKGKVGQAVLHQWLREAKEAGGAGGHGGHGGAASPASVRGSVSQREADLIKVLTDVDMVGAVVANAKLAGVDRVGGKSR